MTVAGQRQEQSRSVVQPVASAREAVENFARQLRESGATVDVRHRDDSVSTAEAQRGKDKIYVHARDLGDRVDVTIATNKGDERSRGRFSGQ
jgi:hypothetical protein